MNDQLKQYFEYLQKAGADVPASFDSFKNTLSNEKDAQTYFNYLKENKFDTPDTFDSFYTTFGFKKKDLSPTGSPSVGQPSQNTSRSQSPLGLVDDISTLPKVDLENLYKEKKKQLSEFEAEINRFKPEGAVGTDRMSMAANQYNAAVQDLNFIADTYKNNFGVDNKEIAPKQQTNLFEIEKERASAGWRNILREGVKTKFQSDPEVDNIATKVVSDASQLQKLDVDPLTGQAIKTNFNDAFNRVKQIKSIIDENVFDEDKRAKAYSDLAVDARAVVYEGLKDQNTVNKWSQDGYGNPFIGIGLSTLEMIDPNRAKSLKERIDNIYASEEDKQLYKKELETIGISTVMFEGNRNAPRVAGTKSAETLNSWVKYAEDQRKSQSSRYGDLVAADIDRAILDVTEGLEASAGRKALFNIALGMTEGVERGVRGIYNYLTKNRDERIAEDMKDDHRKYVTEDIINYSDAGSGLTQQEFIPIISDQKLKSEVDAILAKDISKEEKYKATYPLIKKAYDEGLLDFVYNPNKGNVNITSKSIINTLATSGARSIGNLAIATPLGGGVFTGLVAGLDAAASKYDEQFRSGNNDPALRALRSGATVGVLSGIMDEAAALASAIKGVKPSLVAARPTVGAAVVGFGEQMVKEQAEEIATELIDGDIKNIKEVILATAITTAPIAGATSIIAGRKNSELYRQLWFEAGSSLSDTQAGLKKLLDAGEINQEQYEASVKRATKMSEIIKTMPRVDRNGNPLTDKQKAKYADNLMIKFEAGAIPETIPSSIANEIKESAVKADEENAAILTGPELSKTESGMAVDQTGTLTVNREGIVNNAKAETEAIKIAPLEAETGVTMNLDGTKYEGQGLVIPAASMNTTQDQLTPEMLADFIDQNKSKLSDGETFKVGYYKFPNSNQVSIDLNIVADPKNKEVALAFGKAAGQESLFDLGTFENVKTGADGKNPKNFTDEQFAEIAKSLREGKMPAAVSIEDTLIKSSEAAAKSLEKSGIKFSIIDSSVDGSGAARGNQAIFVSDTGEVIIDKSKLQNDIEAGIVVWHEASHPVMNILRNTNKDLYDSITEGLNDAAKKDPAIARALGWAVDNYEGKSLQNDEALVETVGRINAGVIDLNNLDTGFRQKLIDFVNQIAKYLGLDPILNNTDIAQFKRTVGEVAEALKTGRDIAEIVGEENVKEYMNKIDAPEAVVGGVYAPQARVSENTLSVYDSKEIEKLPVRTLEDIHGAFGGRAVVINSDPTRVGELTLPSGKKIFMYGGPGYLSVKDNVDGNVGFATTQIGKVNSWSKYIKQVFGEKPGVTIVATQSPLSILSNSYALRYVMDAISMLPKSVLRSSDFKNEFFGKDLVLLKNAFGEKQYTEFVNKYKKQDLSNPEVIDSMISEMGYKVGDDNKPASFKARGAFVSNLLGGIAKKSDIKTVKGEEGYVSKKPQKFIAKQLMDRLNINAESLVRAIGEPSLVDLFMDKGKWGMAVSGFETDPNISVESVQEAGVKHPLFNAKFPGKNPFLLDGAYEIDAMFKPVEMTGPSGEPYTKKAAQMLSGSMYVKGMPTEVDGSFEYTKTTPSAGQIQASAGNRNLAPNGKPSNLNPKQYQQVRTPEFKNWFGDWENDPANASKVVDENGEPLVVYHGNKSGAYPDVQKTVRGVFFSSEEYYAKRYGSTTDGGYFLNIRNPLEEDFTDEFNESPDDAVNTVDDAVDNAKEDGLDGGILGGIIGKPGDKPRTDYVVFTNNQIKSATGNTGAFSTTDNRIQASAGNRIPEAKQKKLTDDGKGNYVFFHYSGKKLNKIDPAKFGSNLATGRDEKPGVGISMFYVDNRTSEPGVPTEFGYAVRVPKEKVYPINEDPLNFYDEAKAQFEKDFPGLAFDANKQVGYITKVANENGFDMTITEWNIKGRKALRAQTTEAVKPEVYKKKEFRDGFEREIFTPELEKLKPGIQKSEGNRTASDFGESADPKTRITLADLGVSSDMSARELIDNLIKFNGSFNPLLKAIAKKKNLDDLKIGSLTEITDDPSEAAGGFLSKFTEGVEDRFKGKLYINDQSDNYDFSTKNQYYTLTHELMHWVTLDSLNTPVDTPAYKNLKEIYDVLSKNADTSPGFGTFETYGLSSFNEFMAELFISARFRDYVKDVMGSNKDLNGQKDLVTILVDYLKDLFARVFKTDGGTIDPNRPLIDQATEVAKEMFFGKTAQASLGGRTDADFGRFGPEYSKEFKTAAYVMRAKADGMNDAEIAMGLLSVSPGMTPQEAKDIIDNPEGYIRSKFSYLSPALQENLINRARVKNIYAKSRTTPDAAFDNLEVRESSLDEAEITKKGALKKWLGDFKRQWLDAAKGLPEWVLAIKDISSGVKDLQIRKATDLVKDLKKTAESIGFNDWDAFSKAMRSMKRDPETTSMETGIQPWFANVPGKQLENAPATIPAEIAALPEEIIPFVYSMRGMIDNLSSELVASGFVTPSQALTLTENLGEYVNRAYRLFNEKGYKPSKESIRDARKFLADKYIKQLATESAGMLTFDQIEKKAIDMANKDIEAIISKKLNPYFKKNDSRDTGILKERKDIPAPIRKLMGEYTDPGTAFIITVAKQASLKAASQYLTALRNNGLGKIFFEENDPERPLEFSVRIASDGSESKSPLNGLMTTPEIAEAIESVGPTFNDLTNTWMKLVGAVRWGKTVGSVVTQFKNFESNLGFAVMNGLIFSGNNTEAFKGAGKYFSGQVTGKKLDELTEKVMALGLVNQSVGTGELRKMLGSGDIHDIAVELAVTGKAKGAMNWIGKPFRAANKLYQLSDDFWKVYGYLNERELVSNALYNNKYENLSVEEQAAVDIEASERVKMTQPTYDRVWAGAKYVSERAPIFGNFISFQAEVVRVLGNTVKIAAQDMKSDNPKVKALGYKRLAGMMTYVALRTSLTYAAAQAAGIGAAGLVGMFDDDEEKEKEAGMRKALPQFMRTGDLMVRPTGEPGKFVAFELSSIDPYGIVFKSLNALTEGREGVFSETMDPGVPAAMAEFFSGFLEQEMTFKTFNDLMNNSNPRTGEKIIKSDQTKTQAFLEAGKYVADQLKPSTIGLMQRLAGDNPAAEFGSFFGARPYEVDLNRSFGRIMAQTGKDMEDVVKEYGRIRFDKELTPQERKEKVAAVEERLAYYAKNLSETYRQFLLLGADKKELDKMIKTRSQVKSTGFNKAFKRSIITGDIKPETYFK